MRFFFALLSFCEVHCIPASLSFSLGCQSFFAATCSSFCFLVATSSLDVPLSPFRLIVSFCASVLLSVSDCCFCWVPINILVAFDYPRTTLSLYPSRGALFTPPVRLPPRWPVFPFFILSSFLSDHLYSRILANSVDRFCPPSSFCHSCSYLSALSPLRGVARLSYLAFSFWTSPIPAFPKRAG